MPDGFDAHVGEAFSPAMQSHSIAKLALALAKAQGEFPTPKKTRTAKAGTYSYSYADLSDVFECVRKVLAKYELAVSQPTGVTPRGLILTTLLAHSSGEWLAATYPLPALSKPQEMGSALTYAKRYALCSLLGIAAEEDDDGAAAQHAEPAPKPNGKAKAAEDPGTIKAREEYARIASEIAAATDPGHHSLGLKLDGGKDREDVAFIRKHGGDLAADKLHSLAANRIADLHQMRGQ